MRNLTAPILRFPEFIDEWETKSLNNFLKVKTEKNRSETFKREDVLSVSRNVGVVNQIKHLGRSYAGKSLREYKVLRSGDIVYTKSPLSKNPYGIIKGNFGPSGIVSTLYAVYSVTDLANAMFVDRYFENDDHMNRYMRPLVNKGAKNDMKISNERVLIDSVTFPSVPEQKKIAEFLLAVDKKIEAIELQQKGWKQFKQGMKQALFSQKFRFKADNKSDFPEWENTKIRNLLTVSRLEGTNGRDAQKLTVKLWGKGVYQKKETNKGSTSTTYYSRRAGQLIYSKLDFLNCAFGIIPDYLDGFESTVDLPTFDLNSNIVPNFLLQRITQRDFYEQHGIKADGSRKARRIQEDVFLDMPIQLPSLPEQRMIADTLSAIDDKIEALTQRLDSTQEFKRGLLQKMFV